MPRSSPQNPSPPLGATSQAPEQGPARLERKYCQVTSLNDVCRWALQRGASDLHLAAEQPPWLRLDGTLAPLDVHPVPAGRLEEWLFSILDQGQKQQLRRDGQLLLVRPYRNFGRVRLQVVSQRQGWSITARLFPARLPSLQKLGMPAIMGEWARQTQGLVLIGGLAGSGRSTTAASFVQSVRSLGPVAVQNREKPAELVESDPPSNEERPRRLLLIPELNTPKHWKKAIRAARRHLVVAVCAGNDCWTLLQPALIDPDTARVLLGTTVQALLPRAKGPGRVAAVEVMVNSRDVQEMISRGSLFRLYNVMSQSAKGGMRTQEQALGELVRRGDIGRESALQAAAHPDELRRYLERLP